MPPVTPGPGRRAHRIATVFGLGDRVPAPGTFAGSLPAAAAWLGLAVLVTDPVALAGLSAALVALVTAFGVWAAHLEAERRGTGDPGAVVVDEVAGQWLTYTVALWNLPAADPRSLAAFVAAGFVAFRVFDIVKPWPVRRLEGIAGGVGIMVDDLVAGIMAGAVLALAAPWVARLAG